MKWILLVVALPAVLLSTAATGVGEDLSPVFQVVTYETARRNWCPAGRGSSSTPMGRL